MLNEVIYKGLILKTCKCRYYQVKEGNCISLVEDTKTSLMTLTYTPESTSETLSNILGIPRLGKDEVMEPMGLPKRFTKTYLNINNLVLEKLTHDSHTFNMIIVDEGESRVVQDYNYTTIVVSKEDYKNKDFIKFLFYSGNLKYLKPKGPIPNDYEIRNFPKVIVSDTDVTLVSTSEVVYTLREKHDDYVIRAVDYQDQFILEIRRILEKYGIELVRVNKEKTLNKTSYVSYQFIQTPVRSNHPNISDQDSKVMQHKQPVEFSFRTTDMVLYFDFKNKYNNVDLLTNFCEFKATDKYGSRWTAAIKWGQITEEFNHTYVPDDNSNFSNQCQFRCELYFYEVQEDRYQFLDEILFRLENTSN